MIDDPIMIYVFARAQDHGGVNSAWKDYSSGGGGPNTNYAFDQYDGDEKQLVEPHVNHTADHKVGVA